MIIESLRARRHLAPLVESKAWDRAKVVLEIVTPEQVFAAWREVKLANAGRRLGADSSYFDKCMADFTHKLAAWLNL